MGGGGDGMGRMDRRVMGDGRGSWAGLLGHLCIFSESARFLLLLWGFSFIFCFVLDGIMSFLLLLASLPYSFPGIFWLGLSFSRSNFVVRVALFYSIFFSSVFLLRLKLLLA
ncbi:hypothetical protein BZA05DRAFT_138395 [Tricharina praecox]|uniref:uncharacterized protein n=1 Tax=Tricharina praecox TaxID=43433 RepID=UPI00221EEB08|nr:uncharacterized protein BZA05DRAFT_138395 [Tricharina praecox]KAI5846073.1 hypothetical protein BZA05DRAFT_138395 [Tricharina praecox]